MRNYPIILVLLIFFGLYSTDINSQQTPSFSEYNFNPFIINSAYAGFENSAEITMSTNGIVNQFDGSPRSFVFSANAPLNSDKIGLGGGVLRDQIGVTSITSVYGAYSYKIHFDLKKDRPAWEVFTENVISFGITAGMQFYNDNLLELGIDDDENFNQNIQAVIPTIGAGFLWNKEQFYIGISSPNLLGSRLSNNEQIQLKNTYYAYTGYRFFTTPFQKVLVKPSILIKYEQGAPFQADLNTSITYNNKIEFGIGFRTTSTVNALIGLYALKNLRFIYSYNQAMGNSLLTSTHGIVLSYRFGDGFKNNN